MHPTGILIMYMGGPASLADLEPFLRALFKDPAILDIPLGRILRPFLTGRIIKRRLPRVIKQYKKIGGGSPLLKITADQSELLQQRLSTLAPDKSFKVEMAMRYCRPDTAGAMQRLQKDGCRDLICLSLYPHSCRATTGSSRQEVERQLRALPGKTGGGFEKVKFLPVFGADPGFMELWAAGINKSLQSFSRPQAPPVVLSVHSIPQKLTARGDSYIREVETGYNWLRHRFGDRVHLSFQSRATHGRWHGPSTSKTLEGLGKAGAKSVLLVPFSFVSDHLETLYEIDVHYRKLAAAAGITEFNRVPVFNDSPEFINFLAGFILSRL
jgi:protoporphyrin/coproporphyrin ferrochelatase